MEKERLAREKEEEAKKVKEAKIKEEFANAEKEWEKDKQDMQQAGGDKQAESRGAAQKAAAAGAQLGSKIEAHVSPDNALGP